jgi:L-rhamnose mutarotase
VPIIRKAFRMSVHAGQEQEYERRHRPIWQDLEATLIRHGVRTYSIFVDPGTTDLFAYVEIESEERWAAVAATDECRRWWAYMRDVMPANADHSPASRDLREVFHVRAEPGGAS